MKNTKIREGLEVEIDVRNLQQQFFRPSAIFLAYHFSWNMRLPLLTLILGRGFLCCKISFCSQTVLAAKDLPKRSEITSC